MRQVDFGYAVLNKVLNKHVNPRLLKTLVENWGEAIRRYSAIHQGDDAAYYYNERANLSFLAAAAWLTKDTVALEEYSSSKHRARTPTGKLRKRTGPETTKSSGRVDLYLGHLLGRNLSSAVFEAKHKQLSAATEHEALIRIIRRTLKSALDDVRRDHNADAKFGVCFFVPYFSKSKFKSYDKEPENDIRGVIQSYSACGDAHLWAWCFPKENRHTLIKDKWGQYFFPGVIMALKAA